MKISTTRSLATAVIVSYQSERTIRSALAAARRCHDAALIEVVVVDNNSNDATRSIIQQEAMWARCVFSKVNNGFGRGCNLGFETVTTPYTIFINPDAVVEPDAIRTMLAFIEQRPQIGIVGPAIVEGEPGETVELQDTGACPTPWTILCHAIPLLRHKLDAWPIVPGSAPIRTGWVCGAVFLIRTELMRRLNGFDPRFFLYWEEMDLCKRATAIGYETWAVGTALAHHVGAASSTDDVTRIDGCIAKHYFQSRYYYMVKHHGHLAAAVAEVGEFVLIGMRSIVDFVRGRGLDRLRPRLETPLCSQPETN